MGGKHGVDAQMILSMPCFDIPVVTFDIFCVLVHAVWVYKYREINVEIYEYKYIYIYTYMYGYIMFTHSIRKRNTSAYHWPIPYNHGPILWNFQRKTPQSQCSPFKWGFLDSYKVVAGLLSWFTKHSNYWYSIQCYYTYSFYQVAAPQSSYHRKTIWFYLIWLWKITMSKG